MRQTLYHCANAHSGLAPFEFLSTVRPGPKFRLRIGPSRLSFKKLKNPAFAACTPYLRSTRGGKILSNKSVLLRVRVVLICWIFIYEIHRSRGRWRQSYCGRVKPAWKISRLYTAFSWAVGLFLSSVTGISTRKFDKRKKLNKKHRENDKTQMRKITFFLSIITVFLIILKETLFLLNSIPLWA